MDTELRSNFLRTQIQSDLDQGLVDHVVTRFPPEPNGFLHIGHAKSITVNFGLAQQYGGRCNLRFDDTNPEKESQTFIDAIEEDVRWLGYEWQGETRYASSYFGQLFEWAIFLIDTGRAYVCDLSADEARAYRGTLTEPGKNSPCRERTVAEIGRCSKRCARASTKTVHVCCGRKLICHHRISISVIPRCIGFVA
jgi:glutaminyl-tRNA synthetase